MTDADEQPTRDPVTEQKLTDVMQAARFVLLDFDGPVCDVFAGKPAHLVANDLRTQLAALYSGPVPAEVQTTQDPLVIVRQVAEFAPHLTAAIDQALGRAELEAVTSAALTGGAMMFLDACFFSRRPLAIVSNNSAPAIKAYLKQQSLTAYVKHVQGRDRTDPRRMKPSPYLLTEALTALGADPSETVLVGDSTTDIDAARAVGVQVIGYANKPEKTRTLRLADAVTTSMFTLGLLTQRPPGTPIPTPYTPRR